MSWRRQLTHSVHDYRELAQKWGLAEPLDDTVSRIFRMQVTPHYLNLINDDDPDDPLKKIITPRNAELVKFGVPDIMGEHEDYKRKGLQHRYPETALLLVSNFCAGYCRFCFRKRIFNPMNIEDERITDLDAAIDYVAIHPEIDNVLLSGGDPLMSSVNKLTAIFRRLLEIPHLRYLRIGTKVPAFLPQRIYEDTGLLDLFGDVNKVKPLYLVAHFDHANEISHETGLAVRALQDKGVNMLAHAVLLNEINDNAPAIKTLLSKMIAYRITPYYIFHSMPVTGAEHFQVPIQRGLDVIREACMSISGLNKQFKYILPHYVGKTEVLGYDKNYFYLRQHQAREKENVGRMFKVTFSPTRTWFEEGEITTL